MIIEKPSYKIITKINDKKILQHLENAGRICYKSEKKVTKESYNSFITNLIKRGHESVLEHFSLTIKFNCSIGISRELIRHRMASYSEMSTRYCNFTSDKFENKLTFIEPAWLKKAPKSYIDVWKTSLSTSAITYRSLIYLDLTPQEARGVLPLDLKTEIYMTCNLRELRHILKLRTASGAHPDMKCLMIPLLKELKQKLPIIFEDIIIV